MTLPVAVGRSGPALVHASRAAELLVPNRSAGPHVLVATASRHGATAGIADRLVHLLQVSPAGLRCGLRAVAIPVERQPDPALFDAVVLGSAVYAGRWLESARHYATEHASGLRGLPVWLFSSGPIGPRPFPPADPYDVEPLAAVVGARSHRVFPGRLHEDLLGPEELAVVIAMRAPTGDFRDWPAVGSWAAEIAEDVAGLAPRESAAAVPGPG
ncbi:flavodoxin domain-containing protein [Klenkia terrae]